MSINPPAIQIKKQTQSQIIKSLVVNAINNLKDPKSKSYRPIFHSEDDFKFALACELKRVFVNQNYEVRLERPQDIDMEFRRGMVFKKKNSKIHLTLSPLKKHIRFSTVSNNISLLNLKVFNGETVKAPIDIIILYKEENETKIFPIELKYTTDECIATVKGEDYNLAEQVAHPERRYKFRKDVYRLENFLQNNEFGDLGLFIYITNDKKLLNNVSPKSNKKEQTSQNYSCHCGALIENIDQGWNSSARWTRKKGNSYQLDLKNSYKINWYHYSTVVNDDKTNPKNNEFCINIVEVPKTNDSNNNPIKTKLFKKPNDCKLC